jgi:hypothetical protein
VLAALLVSVAVPIPGCDRKEPPVRVPQGIGDDCQVDEDCSQSLVCITDDPVNHAEHTCQAPWGGTACLHMGCIYHVQATPEYCATVGCS